MSLPAITTTTCWCQSIASMMRLDFSAPSPIEEPSTANGHVMVLYDRTIA